MAEPRTCWGVVLLSFGSPDRLEDVPAYYARIRGGQPPTPAAIAELSERYRRIGGRSPLLTISRQQATALEQALAAAGYPAHVEVGMRFWHPLIEEAVAKLVAGGVETVIGLPLAPHYSEVSVAAYRQDLAAAIARQERPIAMRFVERWGMQPDLLAAWAANLRTTLARLPAPPDRVLFTAHSIPARALAVGDPYPDEIAATARAVATLAGVPDWRVAYQSAGAHGGRWLGPDILEALVTEADAGHRTFVIVPIGFLSDHLEILHDLDIEAQELAQSLGLVVHRVPMLNTAPGLIAAMVAAITAVAEG